MNSQGNSDRAAAARASRAGALEDLERELGEINERVQAIEEEKQRLQERAERIRNALDLVESVAFEKLNSDLDADDRYWNELAELGIQEACYQVLLRVGGAHETTSIRSLLQQMGVKKIDEYANPLAVIHTSLKRIPDRVRAFKRREKVGDGSRTALVRYYEAVKPGAATSSKQ